MNNNATSNFARYMKDISELKTQITQNSFLKKVNDTLIQTGKALLTFRNDTATIYYEGRQLCTMPFKGPGKLSSPYTPTIYNYYLPLIRSQILAGDTKKENYSETTYQTKTNGYCSFTSVLPEILDNMDKERDDEAYQVSGLYKFSPVVEKNHSTVIFLDIEAAFSQTGKKTDRIDLVLYNTAEKQLIFVEVKRLSDSRLYPDAKTGEPAEIFKQLSGYRKRLSDEKEIIIQAYNKVIEYYNELSESTEKIPLMDTDHAPDPLLGLLVVECTNTERYQRDEAAEKFKELCSIIEKNNFKMYTYGNIKNRQPTPTDGFRIFTSPGQHHSSSLTPEQLRKILHHVHLVCTGGSRYGIHHRTGFRSLHRCREQPVFPPHAERSHRILRAVVVNRNLTRFQEPVQILLFRFRITHSLRKLRSSGNGKSFCPCEKLVKYRF